MGALRKLRYSQVLMCVLLLALACGVGTTKALAATKALEFSDMEVKTDSRTGLFGGQYAEFEVTGSLTNSTGKPINKDNVPALTWIDDDGSETKLKADMTQDKLLADETCDVTYKKELSVHDGSVPELTFEGKVEFTGLKKVESELNKQVQAIAAEFAEGDAKKAEEKQAKEKESKDAEKNQKSEKKALEACKGKGAYKAYRTAKNTDYKVKFVDPSGNVLTKEVRKSKKGDEIRSAKVTDVDITDGGWLSDASVTFTIDYETAEARAQREAKEEEERKQAELDSASMGEKNALKSAQNYLSFTAFSYSGLIHQLEFEGYSTEESTYAADHCEADWNEQAAKKAQEYLNFSSFSREGLIDQLVFEGFSYEQAEYGVAAVGY